MGTTKMDISSMAWKYVLRKPFGIVGALGVI
jgi:hypothetical protein